MLASLLLATVLPLNASAFPQQDRAEEFSVAFEKALKFNERADLDKAIRKYKNEGISLFLAKVDARAAAPSPELNRWVDGYIASWERVFRTEFASRYDRYLQLMDSTRRSARGQLLREVLPGINAAHIEALNSKNETDWVLIRRDARQLADNFAGVSDLYYQSFALNILGNAWHPEYTTGDGDGMKALAAYEECLAVRKKLGLTQDIFHENILLISRELRALLGLPEPGARPEGEKKVSRFTIPVEGEGAWTSIPLESTLEAKPGSVAHFNDLADDGKITWKITGIGSVGASVPLRGYEPELILKRLAYNEFVLDGGGPPSEPFKISPKPVSVEVIRKVGDSSISTALRFACGGEREMFHGGEMNFSLHDKGATVFYRPVALRLAKKSPFGPLALWDHDGDGVFGHESVSQQGAVGMPRGDFIYRFDSILLGKGKSSQPFSRWFADAKGKWFELASEDFAQCKEVQVRPLAPQTGTIKVKMKGLKGLKLESLVFVSETSQTKGLLVNVAANSKGVAIPIGRYKFLQGILRGSKNQECLLLPPKGLAETYDVDAGDSIEIELGAPFTLAVQPAEEQGPGSLTLDGQTLVVQGAAGERYARMVGAPLWDVEVSVKGNKKADTKFKASSAEEMNQDFALAYYPADAVITLKKNKPAVYRLTLKKHPWFGNLDTGWLGE